MIFIIIEFNNNKVGSYILFVFYLKFQLCRIHLFFKKFLQTK